MATTEYLLKKISDWKTHCFGKTRVSLDEFYPYYKLSEVSITTGKTVLLVTNEKVAKATNNTGFVASRERYCEKTIGKMIFRVWNNAPHSSDYHIFYKI